MQKKLLQTRKGNSVKVKKVTLRLLVPNKVRTGVSYAQLTIEISYPFTHHDVAYIENDEEPRLS